MLLRGLAERLELRRASILVADEASSERAVLDVSEHAFHVLSDMVVDNPRPRHVVAVLGRVRNAPPLLGNAAFVHQVDDQLELVQALEIGDLWLIASCSECLETSLDQG